ncbi:MAG: sterol desaturase family protein [Pseudomonadota bacterium]
MNELLESLSDDTIYGWETFLGEWFFSISLGFLAIELVLYAFRKKLSTNLVGDSLTNFATLLMSLGIAYLLLGAFYLSAYAYTAQFALFDIDSNWATIAVCVVLADLAYYWEHRFTHRVGMAWATHSAHHSSPHFNISVAYRFGPMDGFWPIFFHLPLVLLGFNPFVVFFAEVFVQLYQTALHTEVIKKFPRPVEAVMNTPSHHRVHHGSNEEYLDANYGGIFIIWDRMFGTFAREVAPVKFGLVTPLNSINPFQAFFHGFVRLGRKVAKADGWQNKLKTVIAPPEWSAPRETATS